MALEKFLSPCWGIGSFLEICCYLFPLHLAPFPSLSPVLPLPQGTEEAEDNFRPPRHSNLKEVREAEEVRGAGVPLCILFLSTPSSRVTFPGSTRAEQPAKLRTFLQHANRDVAVMIFRETAESLGHKNKINFPLDKSLADFLTFPDFSTEFLFLP